MHFSLFASHFHRPPIHHSLFAYLATILLFVVVYSLHFAAVPLHFPIYRDLDRDTHLLRHRRILSNQSYPSPSLMVSTHLSHVQLRLRHPCSRPFVIPLYNPPLYVSKVRCPFPLFSFFSPIHSVVYPSLFQSLQSFLRRLEIAFKRSKETFTSVTFFCRTIFTSTFLNDLRLSLSLSVGNK